MLQPSTPVIELKRGDTDELLDQDCENLLESSKTEEKREIFDEPKEWPKVKHRPPAEEKEDEIDISSTQMHFDRFQEYMIGFIQKSLALPQAVQLPL